MLWADCYRLLQEDEVLLVTSDKAFFENRRPEEGLAKNLAAEIDKAPHRLRLFASLRALPELKTDVTVDNDLLLNTFLDRHRQRIDSMLERNRFRLTGRHEVTKSLHATESPVVLYVHFAVDLACEDVSGEGRNDAVLHLNGDSIYNVDTKSYGEMRIRGERLDYKKADGTKGEVVTTIVALGSLAFGHREVEHTVQHNLDR